MNEMEYRRRRDMRPRRKAPLLFRLVAWTALVLLFLALGFYGSGALFKALDKKGVFPVEGVISKAEDLPRVMNVSNTEHITVGKNLDLKIYTLFQNGLGQGKLRVISDYQESDIQKALAAVFASSDVAEVKELRPAHLFRDGVTLYLDMPGAFVNVLADLPASAAVALRDAIGRTVVENFAPITQIAFLTDGRWATDVNDLPLSKPWSAAK